MTRAPPSVAFLALPDGPGGTALLAIPDTLSALTAAVGAPSTSTLASLATDVFRDRLDVLAV